MRETVVVERQQPFCTCKLIEINYKSVIIS